MSDLTAEGMRLVRAWLDQQREIAIAEQRLSDARSALAVHRRALAAWLLPDDAKPGEKIAVWLGDSLIQAEAPTGDHCEAVITVRKRGRATDPR